MTKSLSRQSSIETLNGINPQSIIALVSSAATADQVNEVRARLAAAKAWAKVHKVVKQHRLDLLRIEVAALKRIGELGALDTLELAADREAAQWLASATDEEVEAALAESGGITTAASLVRKAKTFEHIRDRYAAGASWGANPTPRGDEGFNGQTDEELDEDERNVRPITGILNNIVKDYTEAGVPFTAEDVADAVISAANLDGQTAGDAAFLDGVRRACRQALRGHIPESLGSLPIPRHITCRVNGENDRLLTRIPTATAKLPHLDDMIAIREKQVQDDIAALDRLKSIRLKLDEMRGSRDRDTTPIGQILIGKSATAAPAAA